MRKSLIIYRWLESPQRWTLRSKIFYLKIGDLILLISSAFLSIFLWSLYKKSYIDYSLYHNRAIILLIIAWISIAAISGSYSPKNSSKLSRSLREPIRTALFCWVIYALFYFFAPRNTLPRGTTFVYCCTSCLLTIAWRLLHFTIFAHQKLRQNIVIVSEDKSIDLDKVASKHNYHIIYLNDPSQISHLTMPIHRIVYNPSNISPEYIHQLSNLDNQGIHITSIYTFYEEIHTRISLRSPGLLEFRNTNISTATYKLLKRLLDLLFATIGITIALPFLPIISLIIKLDSRGPIFFSQIRQGKHGKHFKLWKLRTMYTAKEQNIHWTRKSDPRITRFGRLLRKTRVDELPQLWNVLKGELTLVGVRPLSIDQCQKFAEEIPHHNLRHLVTPGITGWAVINQGYVNSSKGAVLRLEYDLYYIKYRSIWLDISILLRTIAIVITLKGL